MTALQEGKGEIAFVQTDIAYYATEGKMMFDGNKIDTISALGALYPETVQLVTTEASGIKTYADLKGKKYQWVRQARVLTQMLNNYLKSMD